MCHRLFRLLAIILLIGMASTVEAQIRTAGYAPYQKAGPGPDGRPESGDEPEGAYQQGPGVGRQEGATESFGIGGGELEIPAIKLKLPRFTLPCITRVRTPAKMVLQEAVAPFVGQVRREFSIAAPESGREPDQVSPEAGEQPEQKPFVPLPNQKFGQYEGANGGGVAAQLRQFEARERALENRIDALQMSIQQLVEGLEGRVQAPSSRRPASAESLPLPRVNQADFPVRHTSYVRPVPLPEPTPQFERLPSVNHVLRR